METLWHDLRYGLRQFVKSPAFAGAAVLSLALGIGANTTIFTLLNTLFLNPLPVERPSELVAAFTLDTRNTTQFGNLLPLSYPNLADFRAQSRTLSGLAGYSAALPVRLTIGREPERAFMQLVTGNYFAVLGLRAVAGRFFVPDEDLTPDTRPVAVIGYGLWQRRFGGDPTVVGRIVRLNARPFTIVGVAPEGFKGITSLFGPELWVPSMMAPALLPAQFGDWLHDRGAVAFSGAGRLKPGVSRASAEADLQILARGLERAHPHENIGKSVAVRPLAEAAIFPGMRQGMLLGSAVLMLVVGLVLLIACANVANLLLARSAARGHEIAVRLALGAGRASLVRQLLTESLALALAGGALGLLFGRWGRDLLWSYRPAVVANNFVELRLDSHVFLFAAAISLITLVIFGLAPALRASRPGVVDALKVDTRSGGEERRSTSLGNCLVAGQVALSFVSLVIAVLFLRGLARAHTIDVGYDTSHLAIVPLNLAEAGYKQPQGEQFYRTAIERLSTVPGVASVSWSSNMPLWASLYRRMAIEGREAKSSSDAILTLVSTVDVDYFATARIVLRRGRVFDQRDDDSGRPVAIINDTMAAKYWPGQEPVGKRFRFDSDGTFREIVGIVKTVKYQTVGESPQPCVYLPLRQRYADSMVLYIRSTGSPGPALGMVQRELRNMGPELPIENAATVPDLIDQSLWLPKLAAGLLGAFGLLALALTGVGVYGVLAYAVVRRTREIGVRIALGADARAILALSLRRGLSLVAAGLVAGMIIALLVARAMSSLLYGVSAADAVSFAAAALVLTLFATVAILLPAIRASRVDPLIALRHV